MGAPTLRLVKGSPLTNAEIDQNFEDLYNEKLPLAGGSMTGPLSLAADPTSSLHAATKHYVDTTFVQKVGDTLTGPLVLAADPTANLQAATKQYVDTGLGGKVARSGDTMTGPLVLPADPTTNLQAATKQYVDNTLGAKLDKSGGTMTGALVLAADPATNLQAATKQYVDGVSTSVAGKVSKSGDTMTGNLHLLTASVTRQDLGSCTGAVSLDSSLGQSFTGTVTGNTTFTISGAPAGTVVSGFIFEIINGGSHTVSWALGTKWVGGVGPTLTASGTDILAFVTFDGTTWMGFVVGYDVK